MLWFILAFLAALFASGAAIAQKRGLSELHAMELSTTVAFFNMLLTLPLLFTVDFSALVPLQVVTIYGLSILASIAYLLVAKSLRHMQISSQSPLLALGPGVTALLAWVILGESLTLLQTGGLLLLICGAYLLQLNDHHDLTGPLRVFSRDHYIHLILLALLIYGLCGVTDRLLLARFGVEPTTYIALVHIFLCFNFIVMLSYFHDGLQGLKHGIRTAGPWIILISFFTVGYRFLQASAIKIAYVALVVSIKRMSILFSTLLGGKFFREGSLMRKGIAAAIMVLGSIMLII